MIEAGRLASVKKLLREGASIHSVGTLSRSAAGIGSAETVKLLLRSGAKAGARNTFKCTPLHKLSVGGGTSRAKDRVEIVEQLVDAGCLINARDSVGRTALLLRS